MHIASPDWISRIRLIAVMVAASVLLGSGPTTSAQTQQTGPVALSPLPVKAPGDDWFGLVQGIQTPDLAFQAGARWDRIIFPWSLIQKNGPDSWDQQYFSDAAIRAQAARGVTMVGVMIYTPQWASIDPPHARPVDKPQGLNLAYNDPKNTWGQFVRKLATVETTTAASSWCPGSRPATAETTTG